MTWGAFLSARVLQHCLDSSQLDNPPRRPLSDCLSSLLNYSWLTVCLGLNHTGSSRQNVIVNTKNFSTVKRSGITVSSFSTYGLPRWIFQSSLSGIYSSEPRPLEDMPGLRNVVTCQPSPSNMLFLPLSFLCQPLTSSPQRHSWKTAFFLCQKLSPRTPSWGFSQHTGIGFHLDFFKSQMYCNKFNSYGLKDKKTIYLA